VIDINAGEVVLLAALAVIIFGPEKLPELARKVARVVNYLRNVANDARGQLRSELGPEYADLHLADLNPRALGRQLLGEDATRDLAETGRELAGTGAAVTAAVSGAGAAAHATAPPGDRQPEGPETTTPDLRATPPGAASPTPVTAAHPVVHFDVEAT
jgi:sec-independent protein translocase protein TatB